MKLHLFKHNHEWEIVEMLFPNPIGYAIRCKKCFQMLEMSLDIDTLKKKLWEDNVSRSS